MLSLCSLASHRTDNINMIIVHFVVFPSVHMRSFWSILSAVSNTLESAKKKTLHKPEYADLEKNVYEWFLTQRQRNCPVNGPMLKARAKVEFEKLHPEKPGSFNASNGWLTNFKKRHGIRYLKI